MADQRRNRHVYLGVFHLLIGIGALAGGFGAIMDPSGDAMGISTEVLRHSPFESFLIPGLFLFVVVGMGNVGGAISAWLRFYYQAYVSGALSGILVLWIVVQVYMLRAMNVLHVVYFVVGVLGLVWSSVLAYRLRLFPLDKLFPWQEERRE
jgi:hypothetical protein